MLYVVNGLATKNRPGESLHPYLRERMEALGMRPSLRQLAAASGIQLMTLQRNLAGLRSISLSNAKALADSLRITIDDLIANVPSMLKGEDA